MKSEFSPRRICKGFFYLNMAEGKNKIVVYRDWLNNFEDLTDEELGKLMRHFFEYVNDLDPVLDDRLLKLVWKPIETTLKRDLKRWEDKSEKNRASAFMRWHKKNANASERIKRNAKNADNDNDSDSDSDNDKDSIKYSQNVLQTFDDCLKLFDDHLHPKTKKQSDNWKDTIDKLNRIEKIPFQNILDIVRKTREDPFWSKNFLSLTKLRKKDSDGVMYVVKFNEQIKSNAKNKRTNSSKQAVSDERLAEIYSKVFADKKE